MTVKSIEIHHKGVKEASPGDHVGIALKNGDYDLLKTVRNQEVIFSGSGEERTRVLIKPKKRKRSFLGFI